MTTTVFSEEDLVAIKRAFRVKKATPEEVCLVVKPWVGTGHRFFQKVWLGTAVVLPTCDHYREIASADSSAQAVLYPAWWFAYFLVLGMYVFVFWVLPRLLAPKFELVVRPGTATLLLRGFGFEREEPATRCSFHVNWRACVAFLRPDTYPISTNRWRLLRTRRLACEALEKAVAPARTAGIDPVATLDTEDKVFLALRWHNWKAVFSEPFVSRSQIAFVLPPPNWHAYFGTYLVLAASAVAGLWDLYRFPDVRLDPDVIASHLRELPLWLPSVLVLAYSGLVDALADPLIRGAVAIIPRGHGCIVIRIGKRIIGEFPMLSCTFTAGTMQYDIWKPTGYLKIDTPGYSGDKGTGPKEEELWEAIDDLHRFSERPNQPRIELHG